MVRTVGTQLNSPHSLDTLAIQHPRRRANPGASSVPPSRRGQLRGGEDTAQRTRFCRLSTGGDLRPPFNCARPLPPTAKNVGRCVRAMTCGHGLMPHYPPRPLPRWPPGWPNTPSRPFAAAELDGAWRARAWVTVKTRGWSVLPVPSRAVVGRVKLSAGTMLS
jgi:hypothetical protein